MVKTIKKKEKSKGWAKNVATKSDTLAQITALLTEQFTIDGMVQTKIPFLSVIRASKPSDLRSGILTPSFCIVAQGGKRILIGSDVIDYGIGSYVISSIDLPTSGQILEASSTKPYYGVKVDFEPKELASVMIEAQLEAPKRKPSVAAFVGTADFDFQETILRLIKLLQHDGDIHFFANNIKRELIYRLLKNDQGAVIYQNAIINQQEAGIGKAIYWIKENYNRPIKVEQLAKAVNMSVSNLHHRFKAVTTFGPLQYQKQLRLQEARRLLLAGGVDAAGAAFEVGYESPSQFSREYRRQFGAPPMKDIENLRNLPITEIEPG